MNLGPRLWLRIVDVPTVGQGVELLGAARRSAVKEWSENTYLLGRSFYLPLWRAVFLNR
jgi:hypothetical protein